MAEILIGVVYIFGLFLLTIYTYRKLDWKRSERLWQIKRKILYLSIGWSLLATAGVILWAHFSWWWAFYPIFGGWLMAKIVYAIADDTRRRGNRRF